MRALFWLEAGWPSPSMHTVLVDDHDRVWWDQKWCRLYTGAPHRVEFTSLAQFVQHLEQLREHGARMPEAHQLSVLCL